MKKIVLAGGCFWGVEAYFKQVDGVTDTTAVYADGPFKNPTYDQVCNASGHAEAVEIVYDEAKVSLKTLLDHFFNIVDPTMKNRQGPDIGTQYRTAIYPFNTDDLVFIDEYLEAVKANYDNPLHVEVKMNVPYDKAEDVHQDYLDKNKNGYCHVNLASVKNVT